MTQGHSERAHAKLSASGAKRWMSCPGSVRLEENMDDGSSKFAEEGTAAHELAEIMLQGWIGPDNMADAVLVENFFDSNKYASKEMLDYVNSYTETVIERINAAGKGAEVLLEERVDFSEWVPGGYGTGDVLIIADGVLEIIDLKYGKGVPVSAVDNPQLRLYALGALNMYGMIYDIETVRMTIIQPRLDSVSVDEMTAGDLFQWAEDEVRPKAEIALSDVGPFESGEHCRFCKARSVCRTLAFDNLEMEKHRLCASDQLTNEETADILSRVDGLVKWANDIKDHAYQQALNGVKYPGYKLVAGKSNRVITDKESAAYLLGGFDEDKIFKPAELKGIGDLEKVLGKKDFTAILGHLIIKPEPKPALVPESDKRPELSNGSEFDVIE